MSEEAKNNREALRCSGEAVITEDRAVDLQREIEAFDLDHVVLLRDIFGNPFRYTAIDLAWLSWNVITLAQGIYADRAFDQLPVLADMLEDAGCTDTDILDHCRGPGPHVRGCWVVDLLLGKE